MTVLVCSGDVYLVNCRQVSVEREPPPTDRWGFNLSVKLSKLFDCRKYVFVDKDEQTV